MFSAKKPLSVKTKLIASFATLCGLVLILVVLLLWTRATSTSSHNTLVEAHYYLQRALELDEAVDEQIAEAHAVVTGAGTREDYDRSKGKALALFSRWKNDLRTARPDVTASDLAKVLDIERSYDSVSASIDVSVSLSAAGKPGEAMQQLNVVFSTGYERDIHPKIHSLIIQQENVVAAAEARSQKAADTARGVAWLSLFLGILVATAVPVVLIRDVVGSLDRLRHGMQRVGLGDYDSPIQIDKRDEFGELADQFNRMSADTKRLLASERDAAAARAEAEAQEKHAQELTDLITVAAHELRHPATLFLGYSEILMESDGDLDDEMVHEAIQEMNKASMRLSRLVTELLDTSRIESGRLALDRSTVEPQSLIDAAVLEIGEVEAKTRIKTRGVQAAGTISVDRDKVRNVLTILLENALKFSPPGTEIEVWYELRPRETAFFVADRGGGIPEEYSRLVFERFYQVGDVMNHSVPGIGLGLYIARTIVEGHGGWIAVEQREGGGSIFSFALPSSGASDTSGS